MEITRLPVLKDNYTFVLHDAQRGRAAVVDPALADPVVACVARLGATLDAILITHHHWDHVDGNLALLEQFPEAVVYASAQDRGRIPGQQVFLQDGDGVDWGDRTATVLFVPGHTHGHIAYYFPPASSAAPISAADPAPGDLFCGDTIFSAGCGRLKEGTPAQMLASLERLRSLPDHTRIWCAHEYTLSNLHFALAIDGDNPDLQRRFAEVKALRAQSQATIPTWLGLEKRTNPFLRWDVPTVQHATGAQNNLETFTRLRRMKDTF
jgi:hydroxyacylglutathione hydrolase